MAPRTTMDGVFVDLLHPHDITEGVETRENTLGACKTFSGEVESCDITIPHGDKIAVRVRFDEDFDFHHASDVKVIIGIGDGKTMDSWAAVQGWIITREAIETRREFTFNNFRSWAANGDDEGRFVFRAPELIDPSVDTYKKCPQRLQWQVNYLPPLGSVIVFVQRGSFVTPESLALRDLGLWHRDEPCNTDPPRRCHEVLNRAHRESAEKQGLLEPEVMRWEWFRPLSDRVQGGEIAIEFRNRNENYATQDEDRSESETTQVRSETRRKSNRRRSKTEKAANSTARPSKRRKTVNSRTTETHRASREVSEASASQQEDTPMNDGEESREPDRSPNQAPDATVGDVKAEKGEEGDQEPEIEPEAVPPHDIIEISDDEDMEIKPEPQSTDVPLTKVQSREVSAGAKPGVHDENAELEEILREDLREIEIKRKLRDLMRLKESN